ncbi:DUF3383 domain-containing protein [Paraburkholderia sp. Ac-20342]|uniref:DUF3383 family protein n=1 Tax=Paraburkholderia sp. Ac-20342 TaxID=2703889 RepID=UPI0019817776|nr:DUF3383 family protein [Paraburkholderia sp. Ac-20342]MBN3848625.1 DUF3383 domain-containing protein [Paraburkholderia sp. Ac-20342]
MTTSQLPISRLIQGTINLAPNAAQAQNLNTALILGSSNVIDVASRMRQYTSSSAVAGDFGTSAPEYLAAVAWFGQSPQPANVLIGRWAQTATAAQLFGATLSTTAQAMSAWTAVTSPAFSITINGTPYTISPASFGSSTNLNGIAALIQTALAAAVAGSTCVWNSSFAQFQITDGTTGATSTLSFASAPTAFGSVTYAVNPSAAATVTIGGTVVTFVSALTTGNQILIGATLAATLANAVTFLNQSADVNLSKATYSVNQAGTALQIVYKTPGTGGNAFTLVASVGTVSGATLSGGSGTDISALLGMTAASSGAYAAQGINAESAVSAVTLFDNQFGQQWYGLTVCGAADPDHLAVAAFIESSTNKHFYGVTTQEAGVLTSTSTTDIAAQLQAAGFNKTCYQYSSNNAYAVNSLLGRQLTVLYTGNNTVITLMFKQEPGVAAETLNATQMAALEGKNCNVFAAYNNGTTIIEPAKVASGQFIDTIVGMDAFAIDTQTALFNALYTSTTKIPQTDPGMHILATTIEGICQQYVKNGLFAPGTWNSGGFGTLNQGDFMAKGYYVYQPPVASQSQANRAARVSVPFQIAVKLAGAVHDVVFAVTVNQ